jgi:hypothetical protein
MGEQRMLPPDYDGSDLIFLIGCARSGTTWLQRLLAAHPAVRTGQESYLFGSYLGPQLRVWAKHQRDRGRGAVGMPCYFTEDEFREQLKRYTLTLLQPMVGELQPGELFLEKTPRHALYVAEILTLLPNSRFVLLTRDARDVVASMLQAAQSWGSEWAPRSVDAAAKKWVQFQKAAVKARGLLSSDQLLDVRYEALLADTAGELEKVIRFLALEWSAEARRQAIQANTADQIRKGGGSRIPLTGDAALRLGNAVSEPEGFIRRAGAGAWRRDLNPWQRWRVWRIARQAMAAEGYPWKSLL